MFVVPESKCFCCNDAMPEVVPSLITPPSNTAENEISGTSFSPLNKL
jgi:hypothetical protein